MPHHDPREDEFPIALAIILAITIAIVFALGFGTAKAFGNHHKGEACRADHSGRYCQVQEQRNAIRLNRAGISRELVRKGYPRPPFANPARSWSLPVLKRASAYYRRELVKAYNLPFASNRDLGRHLAQRHYGWVGEQFRCIDEIWGNRESGWKAYAHNPSSGAHGIPQALPGSKMASYGADWYTNPETQIRWGLQYFAARYGTPCNALSFWNGNGYY